MKRYGMREFAKVALRDTSFIIEILDEDVASLREAIYAFVIGDEIVRIGSSKGVLSGRMRAWERDVSKRLQGRKSPTPLREAEEWRARLAEHGHGIVLARGGHEITTPVGTFPAYLDEESVLIGRHTPPLNWSRHR